MNRFGMGMHGGVPTNLYASPWNQQQQGNQKPNPNDVRFQPSQPLRHHIGIRLMKQYDLLRRAQQRLTDLITETNKGQEASDNGGAKGLGDEQISAERVEQMTSRGSGNGYGMPTAMARWGMRGPPSASMLAELKENREKMEKSKEKVDPLWKYEQLEKEIQLLMQMASTTAAAPMSMGWYRPDITKAKDKRLKEILGPGRSSADSDSDEDDGPGLATGGQQMAQQPYPPAMAQQNFAQQAPPGYPQPGQGGAGA